MEKRNQVTATGETVLNETLIAMAKNPHKSAVKEAK
jgi:hypothetical protein